jgi:hypothetical protein
LREIVDHHDGHGLAETIHIEADEPGPGGASHVYRAHVVVGHDGDELEVARIVYQKGPRSEPDSTTGILDSVLLAIVADRMKAFQAGPFSCRENAIVLTKVQEAIHWLKHRAYERARRGVLGTNVK